MKDNLILTIGRQYVSGGLEIGRLLSEKLGIPCYDKELVTKAAKGSYISEEFFNEFDEKIIRTMYYFGADEYDAAHLPRNTELFRIQADTIRNLAEESSCIFIGRCADVVLRDFPGCINVFLHASKEYRAERIMRLHALNRKAALDMMNKIDKQRNRYYNAFSEKKWNDVSSYDLVLDSGKLGSEKTAQLICDYIKLFKAE